LPAINEFRSAQQSNNNEKREGEKQTKLTGAIRSAACRRVTNFGAALTRR